VTGKRQRNGDGMAAAAAAVGKSVLVLGGGNACGGNR
jgi:hypothetical protein